MEINKIQSADDFIVSCIKDVKQLKTYLKKLTASF